jgi:pyruvate/2-oxoglutarate dehydrogenase complex dihydrolipoamide acyltransferase (E2) component
MQLQEDLAAARGGGGANREDVARIDQQIAQADRVFQGTRAAMEDAGCFESFFIFGRGLVRSPKCLNMNNRVEDARRQLTQLQQQRAALTGGGGNRRRQAELQDALARSGCGGQPPAQKRRGGGLFDFFSGGRDEEEEVQQTPIYRSIDPNGRYRTVCVRLCDGFFYPIHDAQSCQSNCAAPAELYVYRNPGQDIEQAVSLNGSAYMDLPVALRFRKEYVKGCSCKQAEYNPTEIEAANKRAEADAAAPPPAKGNASAKAPAPAPAPQAAAPAAATGAQPLLDLDVTGSTPPASAAKPPASAAQKPPAPPAAAAAPPPPAAAAAAPPPQQGQSTVIKKASKPPVAKPAQ